MNALRTLLSFMMLALLSWGVFLFWLFRHQTPDDQPPAREISEVYNHTDQYNGQVLRLIGIVQQTSYFGGIGSFWLSDGERHSLRVLCNHYPPMEGETIAVNVYVKPLIKQDDFCWSLFIKTRDNRVDGGRSITFIDK